jgi:hypothetical protein
MAGWGQVWETKNSTGGYAVAQLVEALRHKPEGRGLDFRWDF